MTTPRDLRRIRTTHPVGRALPGLWGRLRRLLMSGMGARPDIIHDQDGRHLLPPIQTARCLIVEAPHQRPELAGRPVTFEGFRLADARRFIGWTVGSGTVLLLEVTRSDAHWFADASTATDRPDMLWDARVIGSYDSVASAHHAADDVLAKRG